MIRHVRRTPHAAVLWRKTLCVADGTNGKDIVCLNLKAMVVHVVVVTSKCSPFLSFT